MKILGTKGLRGLNICHLLFTFMWIGGVMALVSLQLAQTPGTREMIYAAAQSHLIVDEYFLIPGGIGIIVTAFLYGMPTKWGIFQAQMDCCEVDTNGTARVAWSWIYGSHYQGEYGVCTENPCRRCRARHLF